MLEEEYKGCAGTIANVIPFSAILEDSWLNRSTPETKAINTLYEKSENALKGYKTLKLKELNHKDDVIKHYAETLDLIGSLEVEDHLNEEDRKMAEFKAAQEEARLSTVERAAQAIEEQDLSVNANVHDGVIFVADKPAEDVSDSIANTTDTGIYTWHLSMDFEGSREFAKSVGNALKTMGITGATIKCIKAVS